MRSSIRPLLGIITLSLFTIYWTYVLIKDPNEHFKQHRRIETDIITLLDKL